MDEQNNHLPNSCSVSGLVPSEEGVPGERNDGQSDRKTDVSESESGKEGFGLGSSEGMF